MQLMAVGRSKVGSAAFPTSVTQETRGSTLTSVPDRTELVARAIELQPLLREHAGQMDAERRISDEVNTALVDAGLFRMLTPRRLGGYESGLRTAVEVTATLGAADGSAAWLVGIGTGAAWVLGMGSREAQDAVFGTDPDARLAGSAMPGVARRVEGGLRMSGRWPSASGTQHATWASLAAVVLDEADEVVDAVMGTVPASELRLEDTWHMVGMRGTGSNTWVGDDVFVPEHMTMSMASLTDAPTASDRGATVPTAVGGPRDAASGRAGARDG